MQNAARTWEMLSASQLRTPVHHGSGGAGWELAHVGQLGTRTLTSAVKPRGSWISLLEAPNAWPGLHWSQGWPLTILHLKVKVDQLCPTLCDPWTIVHGILQARILEAQLVKNLPAVRETWVWSQGWEYSLQKGKATQSHIVAWRIPWTV